MRRVRATEEALMSEHEADDSHHCARCSGPLPPPVERLAVVHGADSEILLTCGAVCLAELVSALAGRTRQPVAGRSN